MYIHGVETARVWVGILKRGKQTTGDLSSGPVNAGKPSEAPERKAIREEGGEALGNLFCKV